jgi:hypothetical protein
MAVVPLHLLQASGYDIFRHPVDAVGELAAGLARPKRGEHFVRGFAQQQGIHARKLINLVLPGIDERSDRNSTNRPRKFPAAAAIPKQTGFWELGLMPKSFHEKVGPGQEYFCCFPCFFDFFPRSAKPPLSPPFHPHS